MVVRRRSPKQHVQPGYFFDLFWLIVMVCFCLGGPILAGSVKQELHQGRWCVFCRIVLRTDAGLAECCEEERRRDSGKMHGHFFFWSLSVIGVWTANPSCTYNTHSSVSDLTHAHKSENGRGRAQVKIRVFRQFTDKLHTIKKQANIHFAL